MHYYHNSSKDQGEKYKSLILTKDVRNYRSRFHSKYLTFLIYVLESKSTVILIRV